MTGLSLITTLIVGGGIGVLGELYGLLTPGPVAAIAVSTAFIVHCLRNNAEAARDGNDSIDEK